MKSNAFAHVEQRFILNIDLSDFFGTVTEARIVGLLTAIGLPPDVAKLIALICTYKGVLPQGSPSSPVVSNMICFRLDRALIQFAKLHRCIVTRYADDITFSSYRLPAALFTSPLSGQGKLSVSALSTDLISLIETNGFKINERKILYSDKHSRRVVTGIKINKALNVDRRFIRNIRATLFNFSIDAGEAQQKFEIEHGGFGSVESHLRGKIAWVGHIKGLADPVFRSLASRFNTNFPRKKIKVNPTEKEKVDRAVWVIQNNHSSYSNGLQGTAFFAEGFGLITAAHNVDKGTAFELYHSSQPEIKYEASIAHISKYRDIAILSHNLSAIDFCELAFQFRSVEIGSAINAVGYPDIAVFDRLNVRSGTVSSTAVLFGIPAIEVTARLAQGMSGGAILDSEFKVVGIIHKGGVDVSRDFAVSAIVLEAWWRSGYQVDSVINMIDAANR